MGGLYMKDKKGLSIIVLVVFSLVIVSVFVTIGIGIARLSNRNIVEEKNNLSSVTQKPIMDFSVCYENRENGGVIKIKDKSANIVMFTCLKVESGATPNVGTANWEYTKEFEITSSGEYLIYGKDVNGNISDSAIINVEM